MASAASTNSFCFVDEKAGSDEAGGRHPVEQADDQHDQNEDAGHAAAGAALKKVVERLLVQEADDQQERHLRQRDEQVRQAHEQGIGEPAEEAGDCPDRGSQEDGDQRRNDADRQRDTAAPQHPGEDVASQRVGAEGMFPGNAAAADGEIDRVDLLRVER